MTDYSKITQDEWLVIRSWALGDYMEPYYDSSIDRERDLKKDVAIFHSISEKLGYKNEKVYRGIKIDTKYLDKLLNNKPFTLHTKKFPIVSWSTDRKVALQIASGDHSKLGVVLNVTLNSKEIVVKIDREMKNAMQKGLGMSVDLGQREVVAKYNKNRRYNLCENIVNIVVSYKYPKKEKLFNLVNNKEVLELDGFMDSGKPRLYNFSCNAQGKLRYAGVISKTGYWA